jgi:hypothetical protein
MAIIPLPGLDRSSTTFKADVDAFFALQLPAFSVAVNSAALAAESNKDATAADRVQTGQDRSAAALSKSGSASDATATAADRLQTGLDKAASSSSAGAAANSAANALTKSNNAADSAIAAAASAASISGGPVISLAGLTGIITAAAARAALSITTPGLFAKADTQSVAFTKTGAGTAQLKAGTYIDVNGTLVTFTAATTIVMPTLTAGTDYAIYACTDGTVRADASFSGPSGYTTATSRKIGGFHFAPGGHSGAPGGGNATTQINDYSFWDVKFKPACTDPRGMTLVAGGFWADIYLLGVNHQVNGTSKYNVTIADGASLPKVPALFGGNGSTNYNLLNQLEAAEVMAAYGKRLPSYAEFSALAYGTTEFSVIGADPVTTSWTAAYISKWGGAQVSGNMWCLGSDFGGGASASGWVISSGDRGCTIQMENAPVFGGDWSSASLSGSRCSRWNSQPTISSNNTGARGVCNHMAIE